MRKYLLPENGNFYKANLHCHSNVSDGNLTPEETKKVYMEQGYSVIAFTDHEVLVPHNELADESFLPITSYEINISKPDSEKCYHLNLYARDKNNIRSSVFDPRYVWGISTKYIPEEMKNNRYERKYDVDAVNGIIATAKKDGFIVSYNHPVWSEQDYSDYIGLKGVWGVEVLNYSGYVGGYPDVITPVDDLARIGEPVIPIATDDNHGNYDRFGGFVVIKADRLDYDSVFSAMERGDLYASGGPLIKELYFEDGSVHVSSSPAANIMITSHKRFCSMREMQADGEPVTEATFDISRLINDGFNDGKTPYFRITVTGTDGKTAYSRPYYMNELK